MNREDAMLQTLSESFSEKKYLEILRFASEIFVAKQEAAFKGQPAFQPTPKESNAQELVYEFSLFEFREIPFSEWEDIAREGMDFLKEFLSSNVQDYRAMPSYKRLMAAVMERLKLLLQNKKYYVQLYDWMNE